MCSKLSKFFLEFSYADKKLYQYQQESTDGNGLEEVKLPFDMSDSPSEIKLKMIDTNNGELIEEKNMDFLSWLVGGCVEGNQNYEELLQDRKFDEEYFKNNDREFPKFDYKDVTERDMFGYVPISAYDLQRKECGVWSDFGYRKFEIEIEGLPEESGNNSIQVCCFWYQYDYIKLPGKVYENKIRKIAKDKGEGAESITKFQLFVDTNRLGEIRRQNGIESSTPEVKGRFEVHYCGSEENRVYSFPLEICLKDSNTEKISTQPVSVDFGTTSTCVAVRGKGGDRLITLSGEGKCEENKNNPYENPTNLLIYNWDEIYRQWNKGNEYYPFFMTKDETLGINDADADYDSGYTVNDEYRNVDSPEGNRRMKAIISQLKMIPWELSNGREIKFTPFDDIEGIPVTVVDDLSKENKDHFDPVAFYGYMLARAVNNTRDGNLYTRYYVTYPAKFGELKEKLKDSLEYGFRRALPMPLRDKLVVEMKHSEPEACVGTILKYYLKEEEDKPKMFAVYDLGGGTLDFCFGLKRPAVDDEKEEYDEVVEILGLDGDDAIGGEHLIHNLAYKLYLDNKDVMKEKKIRFVYPKNREQTPEGMGGLIFEHSDIVGDINVNLLKKNLAKKLFENEGSVDNKMTYLFNKNDSDGNFNEPVEGTDTTVVKINLRGADGEKATIDQFKVAGVDEYLEEEIGRTINSFYDFVTKSVEANKEELSKYQCGVNEEDWKQQIYIFLSGNASQQRYVVELMEKRFGITSTAESNNESRLIRVGDRVNEDKDGLDKKYFVNAKTAVAFGQLNLEGGNSERKFVPMTVPFQYNVGYYKDDVFCPVLESGWSLKHKDWHCAGKVDEEGRKLLGYYSGSSYNAHQKRIPWEIIIGKEMLEKSEGKFLWIRIKNQDHVEYCLGKRNVQPAELVDCVELKVGE